MTDLNGSKRRDSRAEPLAGFVDGVVVGNEFASIEISVDTSGRVRRAVLKDITSGQARYIDPLVLQALVYMSDDVMQSLADPNLIVSD
ncbi:hypothetical protein ABZU75_29830 [Streptosporangium sp. NPDC005286]|uniref:hypothetical protein n=1 Tax=Streptosporangium sp. NPDC005286 TaxID=3154463 RepID=UPI00339E4C5B